MSNQEKHIDSANRMNYKNNFSQLGRLASLDTQRGFLNIQACIRKLLTCYGSHRGGT
jgi:hypothetical protein